MKCIEKINKNKQKQNNTNTPFFNLSHITVLKLKTHLLCRYWSPPYSIRHFLWPNGLVNHFQAILSLFITLWFLGMRYSQSSNMRRWKWEKQIWKKSEHSTFCTHLNGLGSSVHCFWRYLHSVHLSRAKDLHAEADQVVYVVLQWHVELSQARCL